MPILFLAAACLVVALFVALGLLSGRRTKGTADYNVGGRKVTSVGVTGILLGALVGGASTVGTAQMAYEYGLSAWWFTLGGGLGCLLLGALFARPLRRTGLVTIPQFLNREYGPATSLSVMIASSLGTFISVVAQFLAGIALLQSVLHIPHTQAAVAVALIIVGFIYAGGLKSYSAVGRAKILFLYCTLGLCAAAAWYQGYSPARLVETTPFHPFLHLFGRGFAKDGSAGLSLLLGVLSTQIYVQSLFAARNEQTARKGAFLSALLMPPLGLLGIWIGLSLRASGAAITPAHALPYFIEATFPPLVAGALWAGILITVIGCAAGLSLGIATNLVEDLILPRFPRLLGSGSGLRLSRIVVLAVIALATWAGIEGKGSLILHW
ncbi:MAG: sodium:solute symporter family protein, partial [Synergistales bacterium]|nr:sodium:solute symporter family protein [Synergistales bacterium]